MKFSVTKESDSRHLGRNHHGVIFNQSELCFEDIRPITGIDFDILTISILGPDWHKGFSTTGRITEYNKTFFSIKFTISSIKACQFELYDTRIGTIY